MDTPSVANSSSHAASNNDKTEQPSPQQPAEKFYGTIADETSQTDRKTYGVFVGLKQAAKSYTRQHGHTVLYGFIGLLTAALILIIGFWPTFLLVVFATIGIIIGQYRDGNQAVRKYLKDFLDRMR